MIVPKQAPDEAARQAAVEREALIGLPAEPAIDRVTRLAKDLFGVPIALFTVIDHDLLHIKSTIGYQNGSMSRNISFCGHAILQDEVMIVEDARSDPRFADNPLVSAHPPVIFYAGRPIRTDDGHALGSLCLIGHEPKSFTAAAAARLDDLGGLLEDVLRGRRLSESHRQLMQDLDVAKREAMLCPLSLCWNRRGFDQLAEREWQEARHRGADMAVAVIDIDRFKRINDTLGHGVGDRVIAALAAILRSAVRRDDLVARIGGEEFAIVMPGVDVIDLDAIGAKLIGAVRRRGVIPATEGEHFTVSIGLTHATIGDSGPTVADLLERADRALYRSKHDGRDRVTIG